MGNKKPKKPRKHRSTIRAILHYIFLWPSIRLYYLWFKMMKHRKKGKKKERVVIIED
jgi:hypothetical protein